MKNYQFELPCFSENDGRLGIFESENIPGFQINRIFYIFDVPEGKDRANHACMNASTVFFALAGSVRLSMETDGDAFEYLLDSKSKAVFAPQASWIKAYDFSYDAVLVGLSNRRYEECQYINDYNKYQKMLREEE